MLTGGFPFGFKINKKIKREDLLIESEIIYPENIMMKKILIGVGVAILLIIFAGIYKFNYLSNQVGYDVDGNKIQVENEEQMIRSVSPTEFQNLVKSNKYTIIDVRTPDEFKNEALFTDALNIDFYESDFRENLAKLDLDGNYLIY
jgi:hypothetical protein